MLTPVGGTTSGAPGRPGAGYAQVRLVPTRAVQGTGNLDGPGAISRDRPVRPAHRLLLGHQKWEPTYAEFMSCNQGSLRRAPRTGAAVIPGDRRRLSLTTRREPSMHRRGTRPPVRLRWTARTGSRRSMSWLPTLGVPKTVHLPSAGFRSRTVPSRLASGERSAAEFRAPGGISLVCRPHRKTRRASPDRARRRARWTCPKLCPGLRAAPIDEQGHPDRWQ